MEEQRRVSLRALRREFELDDPALDELVEELVDIQRVAVREGTSVLVHVDRTREAEPPRSIALPQHVAEKIRQAKGRRRPTASKSGPAPSRSRRR